jgi:hypothetical protein
MTTLASPSLSESDVAPPVNPYAGPRPLTEGDKLYGRVREVREIRGLLVAHRIVLLYSPSGAGKTSLVEASGGLREQLTKRGFVIPRVIRVGYQTDESAGDGINRYSASVIKSLASDRVIARTAAAASVGPGTKLVDYLPRLVDEYPDDRLCVVFDQFEELFTLDAADHADKWAFLQDLGRALDNVEIWALFAMREDFIAELDPFLSAIPTGLQTRFRLGLLGPKAAEEAALGPCNDVPGAAVEFDPEAAKQVVAELRKVNVERRGQKVPADGPSVEPLQLQLVCRRLWSRAIESGKGTISPADLQRGGVDDALEAYYREQIDATVGDKHADVGERKLRAWFGGELITEDGFRKQVRKGPGNSEVVLQRLRDAYLIRADPGRGLDWYELTHDRFVDPIRKSNREFERQRVARWRKAAAIVAGIVLLVAIAFAFSASGGGGSASLSATRIDSLPADITVEEGDEPFRRFRFEPAAGDVVEMTLTYGGGDGVKADLQLYGVTSAGNGEELGELISNASLVPAPKVADAEGADETGGAGRSAVIRHTAIEAGPLVVGVTPTNSGVTYRLEIRTIESRSTELTVGGSAAGIVEHAGDASTYSVASETDQLVAVEVRPADEAFDPVLEFSGGSDGSSDIVDQGAGGGAESLTVDLEAGVRYTIAVSGYENSTGRYEIEVAPLDAGEISRIDQPDDVTRHVLVGVAGEGFRVEVFPLDDFDPVVSMFDGLDEIAGADSSGSGQPETLLTTLPADGEFTIAVSGYEGSTGEYLISIDPVRLVPLAVGDSARGEIVGPEESVYHVLSGTTDGVGVVEVVPLADFDAVLGVMTPFGPFVVDDGGPGEAESFDFAELAALDDFESDPGLLEILWADRASFVVVSGFDGSTGAYEVSAAGPG